MDDSPISSLVEGDYGDFVSQEVFGQPGERAVFNKTLATATGNNGYERDRYEKDLQLLNHDQIAFPNAMTGLEAGAHQTNCRGNSVIQIAGNSVIQIVGDSVIQINKDRYTKVQGLDDLIVSGTQTYHVKNDARFLYDQNRTVVVGDQYDLSIKGPSTIFVNGDSSEQYVGKHEVTAPEEFEWKTLERGLSAYKLDFAITDFSVLGTLGVDVNTANIELALAKGRGGALEEVLKGQKGEGAALKTEASAEVDAKARVNALPDVGAGTPVR